MAWAHGKNPLAQEPGAGLQGPSELAWLVGQMDFKDINLFKLYCVESSSIKLRVKNNIGFAYSGHLMKLAFPSVTSRWP